MRKLIVLQGAPCSGKSTWCENFFAQESTIKEHWIRVNRDEIRYSMGHGKYTLDHEPEVNVEQARLMSESASHGYNIVDDNTNLNPKTIEHLKNWAVENNYEIEFKLFYVPFKEACARSEKRKKDGGLYISKKVMLGFYSRYFKERLEEEFTDKRKINAYVEGLPDAVICDLDGTLALHQGRQPFDWSRIAEDKIDSRLARLLNMYMENGVSVLFVTGRSESAHKATEEWLSKQHLGTDWELFTRKYNDFSHGDDYKRKVYYEQIRDKYNVLCAFEDSDKCVEMYRQEGILCCQVANCDY